MAVSRSRNLNFPTELCHNNNIHISQVCFHEKIEILEIEKQMSTGFHLLCRSLDNQGLERIPKGQEEGQEHQAQW